MTAISMSATMTLMRAWLLCAAQRTPLLLQADPAGTPRPDLDTEG
jgi:hypothetical protein